MARVTVIFDLTNERERERERETETERENSLIKIMRTGLQTIFMVY